MNYLTQKKFNFRSDALAADAFGVVHFKGFEGFSIPYEFEIMLVSDDPEIDLTAVLQNPAVFTILREKGNIPFNGILARFDQLHAVDAYVFYRAVLVPRFWWLSLTRHNQIFLDKNIPEIIEDVLKDGDLTTDDFEFKASNGYPEWDYICQYGESHLNFVSRWLEREGMYYYFEQTPDGEKLIVTDTNLAHTEMAEGKTMYYAPPSGLDEQHREEVIRTIVCKQKLLPRKLHVNDYNDQAPSLNLSAEAEVLERGRGEIHLYGEHFRTPEEGRNLARNRAEELLSHERRFHGESTIPYLRPGYLFALQNHYRPGFNQQYLTIELTHEGSQSGFLISGIQKGLAEVEKQPYYRNSFVAIPADVQYRHPKTTEKPLFNGTINARIDAEGNGEYAELDDQGRYKVRLPFDVSVREDGKASHWLRMIQPYAGTEHGMHFPLHKGTEVLLTFIEGDPDRPIIAGAVPNPETQSPVKKTNQTQSVIQTAGNNKIRIEDQEGSQRILMQTPTANSWIRVGATNDPVDQYGDIETATTLQGDGIRIRTDGQHALEANNACGEYVGGPPPNDDAPSKIQRLINVIKDFTPTGLKDYGGSSIDYSTAINIGKIDVSKTDTFNMQEGNIYDFGGYWNYSLGNSYAEKYMEQSDVTLNEKLEKDKAEKGGPNPGTITSKKIGNFDDNTWIEKTIGGAGYDYTKDKKSLAVEYKCTEESHVYGKTTHEFGYTGAGNKVSYSKSGGGESEEWKWCRDSGNLLSYSTSQQASNAVNSFGFNWANKASAEFTFSASSAFSFNAAASISTSINLTASLSISAALAGDISIKFAPSGTIEIKNLEIEADFFGFKYSNKPPTELETKVTKLEQGQLTLSQGTMHLTNKVMELDSQNVKLDTTYAIHLMS